MKKLLTQIALWMWMFPCLVAMTGFQTICEYAVYLLHAPMLAWTAATETVNEL